MTKPPQRYAVDVEDDEDTTPRRGYQSSGRLVPIPDPTELTTKLVTSAIDNFRREIEIRFDALDKATILLRDEFTRMPTLLERAVVSVKELVESKIAVLHREFNGKAIETDQKFVGVGLQFSERDSRTDQRVNDTKLAIDAALMAAKEATGKIETSFTKQIDSMAGMIDTKWRSSEDKIADVKDRNAEITARLGALEARLAGIAAGTRDVRTDVRHNSASIAAIAAILVAALSLLVSIWDIAAHIGR